MPAVTMWISTQPEVYPRGRSARHCALSNPLACQRHASPSRCRVSLAPPADGCGSVVVFTQVMVIANEFRDGDAWSYELRSRSPHSFVVPRNWAIPSPNIWACCPSPRGRSTPSKDEFCVRSTRTLAMRTTENCWDMRHSACRASDHLQHWYTSGAEMPILTLPPHRTVAELDYMLDTMRPHP